MGDTILETSLGVSDEDFMKQDHSAYMSDDAVITDDKKETENKEEKDEKKDTKKETDSSDQTDDDGKKDDKEKKDSEAQEQTKTETDTDEVAEPKGDTLKEDEKSADDDVTESLDTSKKDSPDTKGDTPATKEFDYKSAFKKVSEPFKANGIDMQVKDPEDIIRLMQMGANYQQKMARLKPNLKMISMLEKNGLLDEAKLNNLIDLSKKDPKAIAKLIEDSGIKTEDIDKDVPTDYQPKNYSVTDQEFNLDQVLEDIKGSPTFSKTIDVLTKQWDAQSKTAISDNPEIIAIIDTHMGNGVFDKVNATLLQQKALGKLAGISDVEGYQQIAEEMFKQGLLHSSNTGTTEDTKDTSKKVSSKTDAKSQADADRDKKRKAVAPVKQTTTKKSTSETTDFLGLSDEDFMKKHV